MPIQPQTHPALGRHARACRGHPHLDAEPNENVDGRNEFGHDELKARSQFIEPERVAVSRRSGVAPRRAGDRLASITLFQKSILDLAVELCAATVPRVRLFPDTTAPRIPAPQFSLRPREADAKASAPRRARAGCWLRPGWPRCAACSGSFVPLCRADPCCWRQHFPKPVRTVRQYPARNWRHWIERALSTFPRCLA